MTQQNTDVLDYAIIGGGVSGLYAGWRLLNDRSQKKSVRIFEMTEFTGGRLLTWIPYEGIPLRGELGGMRFFKEQELIWNLIDQLGFKEQDKVDFYVDGTNLRYYMRGVPAIQEGDEVPEEIVRRYKLDPKEPHEPSALMQSILDVVLEQNHASGNPPKNRQEWDEVKPKWCYTFKDGETKHLTDVGFWNLMGDILSAEARELVQETYGYNSLTSNFNAAEALESIGSEFGSTPAYKTLAQGYAAVPERLKEQFKEWGGSVEVGHQLQRFEVESPLLSEDGHIYKLYFNNGITHRAKHLILALPSWSLDELQLPFPESEKQCFKSLLSTVRNVPAFKLFLLYSQRWWDDKTKMHNYPINHGRSLSDLPLRQTYYFRPDNCEKGKCPPDGPGLLMVSYNDLQTVDYWRGLEPKHDEEMRREDRKLAGAIAEIGGIFSGRAPNPVPPPHMHAAPKVMCDEALKQLALLHPGVDVTQDFRIGAFADWGLEPYHAGWHFWNPQVDVKKVMQKQVKQPFGQEHQIYIVGEAFSGIQGWVEGALTATELVLNNYLGVPKPDWIKGYYLGW